MAAPLPHRHIHYGSAPRHTTQAPGHMKQLWPVQSTRITAQTAPRAAGLYDGRTPLMIETAHSQMPPEAGRHMRNRGTADIENARHHRLTSVISGGRCRNRNLRPLRCERSALAAAPIARACDEKTGNILPAIHRVGDTRFELVTPSVSGKCATTAPTARVIIRSNQSA